MNNLKNFFLLIFTLLLLSSCGGGFKEFKDTMTGQKVKTTDEFLIQKKDPLILPPDYGKLPKPNTGEQRNTKSKSSLESIISKGKTSNIEEKNTSYLEDAILKELRRK